MTHKKKKSIIAGDRKKTSLKIGLLIRKSINLLDLISSEYEKPKINPVNKANGMNMTTKSRLRNSPPTIIEYVSTPYSAAMKGKIVGLKICLEWSSLLRG